MTRFQSVIAGEIERRACIGRIEAYGWLPRSELVSGGRAAHTRSNASPPQAADLLCLLSARHRRTRRRNRLSPRRPWIGRVLLLRRFDRGQALVEVLVRPAGEAREWPRELCSQQLSTRRRHV